MGNKKWEDVPYILEIFDKLWLQCESSKIIVVCALESHLRCIIEQSSNKSEKKK